MALNVDGRAITLNSGYKMPLIGLGCWQSPPGEVEKAVEAALDFGYRHIDTAFSYKNETEVGVGIHNWLKKTGNKREDIFVVTKLPGNGMYPERVERFLRLSLKRLNLDYVDLYLVHTPFGFSKGKNEDDVHPRDENGKFLFDFGTDHISIWKEMEKMVDLGLAKSIGISNFSIKQTRRLLAISRIPPAVNQVEMHVYFQQKDLHEFSKENKIVLTAYAPLGSPTKPTMPRPSPSELRAKKLLEDPVVRLVADKHHVTPAQVLLRYLVEKDVVVIPKSVNPDRIKSNIDIFRFKLDETDKAALSLLDRDEDGRAFIFKNFPGAAVHPEV